MGRAVFVARCCCATCSNGIALKVAISALGMLEAGAWVQRGRPIQGTNSLTASAFYLKCIFPEIEMIIMSACCMILPRYTGVGPLMASSPRENIWPISTRRGARPEMMETGLTAKPQ